MTPSPFTVDGRAPPAQPPAERPPALLLAVANSRPEHNGARANGSRLRPASSSSSSSSSAAGEAHNGCAVPAPTDMSLTSLFLRGWQHQSATPPPAPVGAARWEPAAAAVGEGSGPDFAWGNGAPPSTVPLLGPAREDTSASRDPRRLASTLRGLLRMLDDNDDNDYDEAVPRGNRLNDEGIVDGVANTSEGHRDEIYTPRQ